QLTSIFGQDEAQALFGLTNVMILFGGSKDVAFNRDISELTGTVRVARTGWHTARGGRNITGDDIPVLRPEDIRQLPERQALVIADNGKPLIARLHRCIDGRAGRTLLDGQRKLRDQLTSSRQAQVSASASVEAALAEAGHRNLGR
ncbi:MAG: TraM recognition domain-containing protein, partial [Propionicimonas sp.]|nr:TraM recognition domain-containing protein [Propionicimonas sp.]